MLQADDTRIYMLQADDTLIYRVLFKASRHEYSLPVAALQKFSVGRVYGRDQGLLTS